MTQHEASRTLVKSPPELWAECSDAASLARHLGQFGEIRITRLEPETAVAWEGEEISGTVRLEPTGWGTKVILTARLPRNKVPAAVVFASARPELPMPEPAPDLEPAPEPEPAPLAAEGSALEAQRLEAPPDGRRSSTRGALAWLRDFFGFGPVAESIVLEPAPTSATEPPPAPAPTPAPALAPPAEAGSHAQPQPEIQPSAEAAESPVPTPVLQPIPRADAALTAALDSLGQAHHRPFSRG